MIKWFWKKKKEVKKRGNNLMTKCVQELYRMGSVVNVRLFIECFVKTSGKKLADYGILEAKGQEAIEQGVKEEIVAESGTSSIQENK